MEVITPGSAALEGLRELGKTKTDVAIVSLRNPA
jgi:hypothetical protein